MSELIVYGGYSYRRYPEAKNRSDRVYFKRIGRDGKVVYLHREIYESNFGKIPKGYHIHHIDENPLNNDISNLACISAKEHRDHHKLAGSSYEKQLSHLENIRPLTKEWHSSEEGIAWHKEHGAKVWRESAKIVSVDCKQCGVNFSTKVMHNQTLFCSNACKSKHRRALGLDNIDRICGFCKNVYSVSRYSKSETCGRSCSNRLRALRRKNLEG
ncbi:HNH endonuclease [Acinetobacter phage vB_AbaM_BP10]|nr:HNH endonuclease [Acinetobacter phage vB_AbaM_BP10]